MTHRDGFPRLSVRSAWRGGAGHREPRATRSAPGPESLGKPPFRSLGRTAGGVGKPCRCPTSPAASLLPGGSPERSLWVNNKDLWYYPRSGIEPPEDRVRSLTQTGHFGFDKQSDMNRKSVVPAACGGASLLRHCYVYFLRPGGRSERLARPGGTP